MQNIIPMRDLSTKTSQIAQQCEESGQPVFVTRNGYGSLVVMSLEAYQKQMLMLEDVKRIDQSLEQIDRGEGVDFYKFMEDIKTKHEL